MMITLAPEIQAALNELARRHGVTSEALALQTLWDRLRALTELGEPRDEWERMIKNVPADCGVSLPHCALSSEGLHE
jgi:transposase-like protein